MTKTQKIKLNVFCSISKNRLNEINNLLIPSLIRQEHIDSIFLTFINFKSNNDIKINDFIVNSNKIHLNLLNPPEPLGFGEAHNFAFEQIHPDRFFLIINPDISLHKNCLSELISSFNNNVGLIETTQLPFAHPKDKMHTNTFETNWASGCCLLINSLFFKKINGFDPNYWMYLEDVDLSWKSWINGYKVLHNPKAISYHYTGVYFKYSSYSYSIEDFWSMRNFLYLSRVYFGEKGLEKALKMIESISYYDENLKREVIHEFNNFKKFSKIKDIHVPRSLRKKIHIFGYNKFSKLPL